MQKSQKNEKNAKFATTKEERPNRRQHGQGGDSRKRERTRDAGAAQSSRRRKSEHRNTEQVTGEKRHPARGKETKTYGNQLATGKTGTNGAKEGKAEEQRKTRKKPGKAPQNDEQERTGKGKDKPMECKGTQGARE